ncbi:MAG: isoleucine--tRNA ligase [Deltaproteobacteria bacterium]
MSDNVEYKNTLNLPRTDFPMKADLPKKEPLLLDAWRKDGIYRLIRQKSSGKSKYVLHDGPPYANGDIHIGHALNKTLKDIVVKYNTMLGSDSPYVPGWDCHGLPVEHQLFKELGITKHKIGQLEFRKKAYDYALKYVSIQKEEFMRLGVFGDWDNPYLTLTPEYEEGIVTSFNALVKKGYIYRGLKPVNWCPTCETALAEAEVEYEEHTSPSIYVKFEMETREGYAKNSFLVIWTTTPWTLLANVAVAAHPGLNYSYVRTENGNLIVGSDLLAHALKQMGVEKYELIREIPGKDLEGLTYAHPFGIRKGRVVLADYVSKEEGTGLVHTAPGHGAEDYQTGLKYKLDIIMPVDAKGRFDDSTGEFSGMRVYEANKVIMEKLRKTGALIFNSEIRHSYPHCWRCKNPIIFRATKQWFLRIDEKDLRKKVLAAIKSDIEFVPAAGKERISAMVELRPDWCLSRQRYWGVPIPALVCSHCHEEILDTKVIDKFAGFVAKEGSDSWFQRDIEDFLPAGFKCPYCAHAGFLKGADILDVWFDSGVSHQAVLKKRKELGGVPCALYLEGSDQHRGWFQSSLIPGICIDGKPPFKTVLTHGFVVDGLGRKMSKSTGNVISPLDIIKDYGADILRLWVASSDYNEDIRISPEILKRLTEAYRKIRNTARFILSNLCDFDPDSDRVSYGDFKKIDKWVLWRLQQVLNEVDGAYKSFEFYKAYKAIYDFCNEDLSMYYLDMVKGRLYTKAPKSLDRRAAQTAIYEALHVLIRLAAPILVFTCEEIWRYMPKEKKGSTPASVHLSDWPKVNPEFAQQDLVPEENIDQEFKAIIGLIPDVAKALEERRSAGIIGSSFDAKINLLTNNEIRYKYLESLKGELPEIFKVSQVGLIKKDISASGLPASSAYPDIAIEISKAEGKKCVRCWNYSLAVGSDEAHPLICDKCSAAIGG